MTDYNDSYGIFVRCAVPRKHNTICDRRNAKQALLCTAQNSDLNSQ